MGNSAINIFALLVALVVGYGVLSSRDDGDAGSTVVVPALQGYYLKNAVISETGESGAPRLKLAASMVQQDPADNSVRLTSVNFDYRTTTGTETSGSRWTMSADQGVMPTKSDVVELSGNVIARTVDAPRRIVLRTPALKIDTVEQSAHTNEIVGIDIGDDHVNGQGLDADLPHERLHIGGHGELRLAAQPTDPKTKISLPGIFENEGLELKDGGIRLRKVRSRTEPLVQADEAIASSTDLDNNRLTLRGNVRLNLPEQGDLQADSAIIIVRDSRIVRAIASGQPDGEPVRFEHERKVRDKDTNEMKTETAKGRAQSIDYDVLTGILNFKGNVWFSTGRFETSGKEWKYNLIDGSGSSNERSTTIVHPREGDAKKIKP